MARHTPLRRLLQLHTSGKHHHGFFPPPVSVVTLSVPTPPPIDNEHREVTIDGSLLSGILREMPEPSPAETASRVTDESDRTFTSAEIQQALTLLLEEAKRGVHAAVHTSGESSPSEQRTPAKEKGGVAKIVAHLSPAEFVTLLVTLGRSIAQISHVKAAVDSLSAWAQTVSRRIATLPGKFAKAQDGPVAARVQPTTDSTPVPSQGGATITPVPPHSESAAPTFAEAMAEDPWSERGGVPVANPPTPSMDTPTVHDPAVQGVTSGAVLSPAPTIVEEVVKEIEVPVAKQELLDRWKRDREPTPAGGPAQPGKSTFAQADLTSDDHSLSSSKNTASVSKEQPRTISAQALKEEAERVKIAQQNLAAETKKKAPVEATPAPVFKRKKTVHAHSSLFQQILASLNHIGLGKERTRFIQNLGTMLNAGLPLLDAIHTLGMEIRVKPMKRIIGGLADMVENGTPLWRAMEAQQFFSAHSIALVRIGEEAGNLAKNLVYLSEQEEKDAALRSKVTMAMIYPSIVVLLMVIVVIILGVFVLPNLIGVLTSLNAKLPLVTRLLISVTKMFTQYGAIGIPALFLGMIVLVVLTKFTSFKVVVQWIQFRIPGVGALASAATIARFGVILGGLMRAGVPVVDALQSLVDVTPIVSYKRFYQSLLDHITVGDSFSRSFQSIRGASKLLPTSVQQLVITGERSGALSEIMMKVAAIYEKKASEIAERLPIILEPMILLFLGGLVGSIAFGILVPIYSIVGNVSH